MVNLSVSEPLSSLADVLGVINPVTNEEPSAPPKKFTARDFCRSILQSREYRESIMRRVVMDALPHSIEQMIWDRAEGKIAQKIEVNTTYTDLQDKTDEELASEAEEIAMRLREAKHAKMRLVARNGERMA